MAHARISAIAFDAVGTLLFPDPPAAQVYRAVGQKHGSRLVPAALERGFIAALEREEARDKAVGWRTSEEREVARWQAIVRSVLSDVEAWQPCFEELFAHFAEPKSWCHHPSIANFLDLVARGCALAVASNYDRRLRSVMSGKSQLALIQTVVISSEIGWRKPSKPFFARLCQALAREPGQILFVGDDPEVDCRGAEEAGLQAVLFDPAGRFSTARWPRVTELQQLIDQPLLRDCL